MTLSDVWSYAGGPFIGGMAALWGFLKLSPAIFMERGFGHYLDAKLEVIKRDHTRGIEGLKSDLAHLADRGIRSNEREYEALTAAWGKFMDAFYATRRCLGGFQTIPDFPRMTDEEIGETLDSMEVDPIWKKKIMASDDRHKTYSLMCDLNSLHEAGAALAVARDTVRRQSVFIPVELNEKLEASILTLQEAYSERRVSMQIRQPIEPVRGIALMGSAGEIMFADIRAAVRDRLLRQDVFSKSADA